MFTGIILYLMHLCIPFLSDTMILRNQVKDELMGYLAVLCIKCERPDFWGQNSVFNGLFKIKDFFIWLVTNSLLTNYD